MHNTAISRICLGVILLCFIQTPGNSAAEPASDLFYPIPLNQFYQRTLSSYSKKEAWGAVPRGLVRFDGVPFVMEGKIELNGMGASRSKNFMPARVGEIPVNRHALRIHWIGGAGYKDPDDTPIAEFRLNYKNGRIRHLFIKYGEHVRNWYVESDEKRTDLTDPRGHIVWHGTNVSTGRPLRLFKNTFDNPLPSEEIQSIQILSLFGKSFLAICSITLEQAPTNSAVFTPAVEEPDDTPFRRETLLRIVDADTAQPIKEANLTIFVTEDERTFGFGRYRSDRLGQILFDYPPETFSAFVLTLNAAQYIPVREERDDPHGILPAEIRIRCKQVGAPTTEYPRLKPAKTGQ